MFVSLSRKYPVLLNERILKIGFQDQQKLPEGTLLGRFETGKTTISCLKYIGLFLKDWITLNDSFKVYESFRVMSPNFNSKTSLKSFSIGKLSLNNDYDEGEKLNSTYLHIDEQLL